MCCLAFLGFLKVSEFTIPMKSSYDLSCHLSLEDIIINSRKKPRLLQLFLKQSKTDPSQHGLKVYVGTTDTTICPIKAIVSYLTRRNKQPGPLFITKKGQGWISAMFCTALKSLWTDFNLDKQPYNPHSFRIRAATSASTANMSDSHI